MIPASEQSIPERLRAIADKAVNSTLQYERILDIRRCADEIERQQAELKTLQEQISEVDEILIVNWVGPRKDGDYRKSLSDLIRTAVMEHQYFQGELQKENDSLKVELERLRGEREQDTARLDWLQRTALSIPRNLKFMIDRGANVLTGSPQAGYLHDTLRQAIDAARDAAREQYGEPTGTDDDLIDPKTVDAMREYIRKRDAAREQGGGENAK